MGSYGSYGLLCKGVSLGKGGCLLLLGLFFTIERSEKNLSPFAKGCYFLLASLLIIIAVGCNELTLIVLDCIIPFLLYTKWKQKASIGYLWGWLAIAGFFSAAMFFAPGNFARLELCQKFSDFSHVPFFSVIFTFEFLSRIFRFSLLRHSCISL